MDHNKGYKTHIGVVT